MQNAMSKNMQKTMKRPLQCVADPRLFRAFSDHEPVSPQPARSLTLLFFLRFFGFLLSLNFFYFFFLFFSIFLFFACLLFYGPLLLFFFSFTCSFYFVSLPVFNSS